MVANLRQLHGKFFGKLIVSDFDSTFFERGYIPPRNLEATQYFMENGGYFTIITARPVESLRTFLPLFAINAPAGLANGAVLYDFAKDCPLYIEHLDTHALSIAREVYHHFPQVRIELFTDTGIALGRDVQVLEEAAQRTRPKGEPVQIDTFSQPLTRIAYLSDKETVAQVARFVTDRCKGRFDVICSNDHFFNIRPTGASKGRALELLAHHLQVPMAHTYAIGDHFNDLEMLQTAGNCACPGDAQEVIKDRVDLVTCPMAQGAVADLVKHINQQLERKA